jgi:broad specificity phosphatase PhoE
MDIDIDIEKPNTPTYAFLRHSIRSDQELNFDCPPDFLAKQISWNPSITPTGHAFAFHVAKNKLQHITFQRIVSSPFLRCLETTFQAMKALNISLDKLVIDAGWCEVFHCIREFIDPTFYLNINLWEQNIREFIIQHFQCTPEEAQKVPILWDLLPKLCMVDNTVQRVETAFRRAPRISTLFVTHLQPVALITRRNIKSFQYCCGCTIDHNFQLTDSWGLDFLP